MGVGKEKKENNPSLKRRALKKSMSMVCHELALPSAPEVYKQAKNGRGKPLDHQVFEERMQ